MTTASKHHDVLLDFEERHQRDRLPCCPRSFGARSGWDLRWYRSGQEERFGGTSLRVAMVDRNGVGSVVGDEEV